MLTLWQFPPCFGLPSPSPFCMKLEGFLRLADLPYRTAALTDLREAPKGKGPFIEEDGRRIGDSALVIDHLEARHGIDLDRGLDPAARAIAHGFGVMLEERTYFALVFNRWMEEPNWPVVRDTYFGDLPAAAQDGIRETCPRAPGRPGAGRPRPRRDLPARRPRHRCPGRLARREALLHGRGTDQNRRHGHCVPRPAHGGPVRKPPRRPGARPSEPRGLPRPDDGAPLSRVRPRAPVTRLRPRAPRPGGGPGCRACGGCTGRGRWPAGRCRPAPDRG